MVKNIDPVIVSITSGKGGVGKTSIAVNLAYALLEKGRRVLMVDGDLGLANMDVMLGVSVNKSIRDVLDESLEPHESIVRIEPDLGLLPASSGVPEMVALTPDEQLRLTNLLKKLTKGYDFVLLDTAAGIGPLVLWLNRFARFNIIVLSPDPASLTDAYAMIKILSSRHYTDRFYVVVNFVSGDDESREAYQTLEKTVGRFLSCDLQNFGTIPRDKAFTDALRRRTPFVKQAPECEAALAIRALAEKILELERLPAAEEPPDSE